MRRVFDGFLFFNELDILEIRLREMSPYVDYFVLVESEQTFQGNTKPLYYKENQARFEPWAEKIIHVIVPAGPIPKLSRHGEAWDREYYQRNQIVRGLTDAQGDDLIIVSDVDEIISSETLARVIPSFVAGQCLLFEQAFYRFHLNRLDPTINWEGPRMVERRHLTTPQKLRRMKARPSAAWTKIGLPSLGLLIRNWMECGLLTPVKAIEKSGWHFTSIGTFETWREKVDAYSHSEHKDSKTYNSIDDYNTVLNSYVIEDNEKLPQFILEDKKYYNLLSCV